MFRFNSRRQSTVLESYVLPFLTLLLIVLIDRRVDSLLLTPMLAICLIGILAFRMETKVLAFWFAIISCTVILSLAYSPGRDLNPETIVARTLVFIVAGSVALATNRGSSGSRRKHRSLLELLERLSCAVVVSDSSGTILFSNKKALRLLKTSRGAIVGLSFFSFFTLPEQRGQAIEAYLRLIEQMISREVNLTLMLGSDERQHVHATQIPITFSDQKCIVTVIDTDTPEQTSEDDLKVPWLGVPAAVIL